MNLVYVLVYVVLWPVFRILLPAKAVNKHNLPDRGALYCANHTRLNDPFFVVFALGLSRQVHVMAKDEVMHWPVLGWLLKKGGVFGVKRGKSDVTAIRTALTCLKNGENLLLFPEGTRHQNGDMGDAKTGAAMLAVRTGAPIVPIYIPAEKHWFRFTPVVFGEPYYPKVAGRKGTSEEYRAIAEDLMGRIEALKPQAER